MSLSLEQIISNFDLLFNDSYHQICDSELRFRYVGNKFANLLELDKNNIIGYNLSNIKCPIQHLAKSYYELNYPVLVNNSIVKYATVVYRNHNFLFFKNKVSPIIINGENKGIIIQTNCDVNNFMDLGINTFSLAAKNNITIHSYNTIEPLTTMNLSDVEEIVIFLIIIGKQDKEISRILYEVNIYISSQAISKIITRKIYSKLHVSSRSELINKVFQIGLASKIPKLFVLNPKLFEII